MLKLKSIAEDYAINLPTNPNEIPTEYLKNVSKGVNLPEHYAIIALVRQVRMYDFLLTINNPKAKVRSMDIAILAKINSENVSKDWAIGQKVVINEADVAMGTHITLPTILSLNSIVTYFMDDNEYFKSHPEMKTDSVDSLITMIMSGKAKDNTGKALKDYPICFLSFKIVPVTAIKATTDINLSNNDMFIITDKTDCKE